MKKTYNTKQTSDLIKEIERLRKFVPPEHRFPLVVTPEMVIDVVSDYFNLDKKFMSAYSNYAEHVEPRQIAIYVAHTVAGLNKSELGRIFKRNHASIINSLSRVTMQMVDDNRTSNQIQEIAKKCLDLAHVKRLERSAA